jgi:hypothetical protein
MYFGLNIRFEKHCVEDIVYLPSVWQFQSICNRSQYFINFEGSFLLWCHLFVVICFHVSGVQPDFLSKDKNIFHLLSAILVRASSWAAAIICLTLSSMEGNLVFS